MRQAYDYWQDQPGSPQGENTTASRPQRPSLRTSPARSAPERRAPRNTPPRKRRGATRPHDEPARGAQGPTDSAFNPDGKTHAERATHRGRPQLPTDRTEADGVRRTPSRSSTDAFAEERVTPPDDASIERTRRHDPRNKPPLGKTQCSVHKPLSQPSRRRTTSDTSQTRPERTHRDATELTSRHRD